MRSFVAFVGSSPKLLLLKISQPMPRLRTPSTYRRRRRRSNPHSVVSCYSSWRLCVLCKCSAIYSFFSQTNKTRVLITRVSIQQKICTMHYTICIYTSSQHTICTYAVHYLGMRYVSQIGDQFPRWHVTLVGFLEHISQDRAVVDDLDVFRSQRICVVPFV